MRSWTKELKEELFASFFTFFGQYDRFRFSDWVENHAFFVEPTQRIPVMTFPRPAAATLSKKEECEHCLVDFVFVILHTRDCEGPVRRVEQSLNPTRFLVAYLERVRQEIGVAVQPMGIKYKESTRVLHHSLERLVSSPLVFPS